jgi:hypothetical protein
MERKIGNKMEKYNDYYLDFVKWQQEKNSEWKPVWTQGQVEFANELMFWIENISELKKGMTEIGDKKKIIDLICQYYKENK